MKEGFLVFFLTSSHPCLAVSGNLF